MCYLNEYSCTVQCLNSDLNVTAALNKSIQSISFDGHGCTVTACNLIEHHTSGQPVDISMLWDPIVSFILFFAPVFVLLIIIAFVWLTKPPGPQT